MPKITLEEFFNKDTIRIIECTTKEQSDVVRKAFAAIGAKWSSGDSYLTLDYWNKQTRYMNYNNQGLWSGMRPSSRSNVYSFDDIVEFSSDPISETEPEPEPEPDPNQLRVLLRGDYCWHDACWDIQSNKFSVDGNIVKHTSIVSIENYPHEKYVRCTKCGSIIKNTKKAIQEHAQLALSSKACLTCRYLNGRTMKNLKESLTKNADGVYIKTMKSECLLTCGYAYSNSSIDDVDARNKCQYRHCGADTVGLIDNFFAKYPGAFDDMATVDALDMSEWQINCRHAGNALEFKWTGRYSLYVHTTGLGIIDRFECNYRNNIYTIVYSKKYDKMFTFNWGEYSEFTATNSLFSTQYYNTLMKIMRNIYKGEN